MDHDFSNPDCHVNIPIIVVTAQKKKDYDNVTTPTIRTGIAEERFNRHHHQWIVLQNTPYKITSIVSLHPDEATDSIVDIAIELRIPFCIVPCCVFARLFSHRQRPQTILSSLDTSSFLSNIIEENETQIQPSRKSVHERNNCVSTYAELLDYLQSKHPSIQRTQLPFRGSNVILWLTF
jgi:hypothetical protein